MTGSAYIGEVLIQIWLKSIEKWVKQMNAQKESFKTGSRRPMKKCAMKMKETKKKVMHVIDGRREFIGHQ